MEFKPRKLEGVYEIALNPLIDSRGFFMRSYDLSKFKEMGLNIEWKQENHSMTISKGTIRGLHFQFPPYSEAKLVRCIKGAILNVFVDLRKGSKSFGKWDAVELNEENKKMVFIPRGFANGFCILKNNSELLYKTDNDYNSDYEGQIIWNDEDLKIQWPFETPKLSKKDLNNMSFDTFIKEYKYLEV